MYQLKLFVAITISIVNISAVYQPISKSFDKTSYNAYREDVNYRLPNSSYPEKYNIELTWIDDITFIFNGIVTIDIVIRSNTDTIVLHKRSDIQNVILKPENGEAMNVTFLYSNVTDFMTISSGKLFKEGSKHTLEITYQSILNTNNRGFFRQSYDAENGEKRQDKHFLFTFCGKV